MLASCRLRLQDDVVHVQLCVGPAIASLPPSLVSDTVQHLWASCHVGDNFATVSIMFCCCRQCTLGSSSRAQTGRHQIWPRSSPWALQVEPPVLPVPAFGLFLGGGGEAAASFLVF